MDKVRREELQRLCDPESRFQWVEFPAEYMREALAAIDALKARVRG